VFHFVRPKVRVSAEVAIRTTVAYPKNIMDTVRLGAKTVERWIRPQEIAKVLTLVLVSFTHVLFF
jgi:hypothetical protein